MNLKEEIEYLKKIADQHNHEKNGSLNGARMGLRIIKKQQEIIERVKLILTVNIRSDGAFAENLLNKINQMEQENDRT